jgi:hypothetical protein
LKELESGGNGEIVSLSSSDSDDDDDLSQRYVFDFSYIFMNFIISLFHISRMLGIEIGIELGIKLGIMLACADSSNLCFFF